MLRTMRSFSVGAAVMCSSFFSTTAMSATLPLVFEYEVFQSAFTDVPVGTIIRAELNLSTVPSQTTPPYDTGAVGEDQLGGSANSRFDDLATLNISFLGRDIDAAMGSILTFNGFSTQDTIKVTFSNSSQTEITAADNNDLEFAHPSFGSRVLQGINMEFNGPTTLLDNQYVDDALDILANDPFAWTGVAGVGPTTKAPRRLQFAFGTPGLPEINATLVPVPAAVWLLGSGLIGLVGIRRRQSV